MSDLIEPNYILSHAEYYAVTTPFSQIANQSGHIFILAELADFGYISDDAKLTSKGEAAVRRYRDHWKMDNSYSVYIQDSYDTGPVETPAKEAEQLPEIPYVAQTPVVNTERLPAVDDGWDDFLITAAFIEAPAPVKAGPKIE